MSTNKQLDPYVAQAEQGSQRNKFSDVSSIIASTNTAMFSTRSQDGSIHSRAMIPINLKEKDMLNLFFFANNQSAKFDELQFDPHVNVSFYDQSTSNWASFAGFVKIVQDKTIIHENWNENVSKYYGDLRDGIHNGDENDPRVSLIEVRPQEIRYWIVTSDSSDVAPGQLRTITQEELSGHGGATDLGPASQHFSSIIQSTYQDQIPGLSSYNKTVAAPPPEFVQGHLANVIQSTYDNQQFGALDSQKASVSNAGGSVQGHLQGVIQSTYESQQFGGNAKDPRSREQTPGLSSASDHFSNVMNSAYANSPAQF